MEGHTLGQAQTDAPVLIHLKDSSWFPHQKISFKARSFAPSYYFLYSLYNKIRDKGKIVSAGY
jgi:hypothetical protein